MNFKVEEAIEILERTPDTLAHYLAGLSEGWLHCDEGEGTWNAVEVVEHLIEAEKHNWLPRLAFIIREGESKPFPEFDRFSHLHHEGKRPAAQALADFKNVRLNNVNTLKTWIADGFDYERAGFHPAFGPVKTRELLSTWVVHDFTHIAQIARVMAERYRDDVGPWQAYLGILNRK